MVVQFLLNNFKLFSNDFETVAERLKIDRGGADYSRSIAW